MLRWRLMVEEGRKAGRHTFSQPDLIIAATAFHKGLTVVSRDVSDYQRARTSLQSLGGSFTETAMKGLGRAARRVRLEMRGSIRDPACRLDWRGSVWPGGRSC